MDVKGRKKTVSPAVLLTGLAVLFLCILSAEKELGDTDVTFGSILKQCLVQELGNALYNQYMPVIAYIKEEGGAQSPWWLERQVTRIMPLYGYSLEEERQQRLQGEPLLLEDILLAEAGEGSGGNGMEGENTLLENMERENAVGQENTAGMQDTAGTENAGGEEHAAGSENALEQGSQTDGAWTQQDMEGSGESLEELLKAENDAAAMAAAGFLPHQRQITLNMADYEDYENLVRTFYTIDANTMAGSDQLNVTKLMEKDATISKDSPGPQILLYHTHSQEAFADSVPGDASTTIMGVGDRLAEILTTQYGYEVLHHKGTYDVESRDDAYSNSLPALEQLLQENPSIQVVIDLHRDQMAEETRLVMDLDGRPTARFMFFNGLSRTRTTGNISYLYNEYLEDNLSFSFQMQMAAAEYYPGLTRRIYLKGYRYNMHLCPKTLLVELGAQNNTVEEVMNACDPLAHILDLVLSGQE